MARTPRRARYAPRFDLLEGRSLLSGVAYGPWPMPAAAGPASAGLFVRFRPSSTAAVEAAAVAAVGGRVSQSFPGGTSLVLLGSAASRDAAVAQLAGNPAVLYAQGDSALQVDSVATSDPLIGQEWGMGRAGIDATDAWGVTTGNPSTIVAVLDTGIDLTHPALASKVWVNPGVVDGVSNDRYADDINGWNFVANNNDVQDDNGHGTHVSGTIAAADDGAGTAGVDWNARIMPLKVLDSAGSGTVDAAVSAIYYAVAHGARVINASWGNGLCSQALSDAIAYAGAHDVVFVAAAGNDGTNSDATPEYPADDHLPNELSVGAVDATGHLAGFSDYGVGSVDVAAPGVDILSTVPGGGYQQWSGTSMATPHVTGIVSLLVGLHPEETPAQIVATIKQTSREDPALSGLVACGGIADAYSAVTAAPPAASPGTGGAAASSGGGEVGVGGAPALAPGASAPDAVRAAILSSDEYFAAHGGTATGFVSGLYHDLLGRAADPTGLAGYVALVASGTSRAGVVQAIQASPEAARTKVARWYQSDLGRAESVDRLKSDPGVLAYASMISAGTGDDAIRAALLGSAEAYDLGGGTATGVVSALYRDVFGRDADPGGLAFYAGLISSGAAGRADVARIFLASPEGKDTAAATWYQESLMRTAPLDQLKSDPGVVAWGACLA